MGAQSKSKQNVTADDGDGKKKGFFEKVKEHKKEIAISAVIVIATVLVVKNKGAFQSSIKSSRIQEALTSSLENQDNVGPLISESISTSISSNFPIDNINVRGHVRNLPEGWKPSSSRVELAAEYGYSLGENQTFVSPHTKVAA